MVMDSCCCPRKNLGSPAGWRFKDVWLVHGEQPLALIYRAILVQVVVLIFKINDPSEKHRRLVKNQ